MSPEELNFQTFFAAKIKDRGISLKKLSEMTGIAPVHLENLLHGNFEGMPPSPYFRGYLVRLGKALDFDGEEWWGRIKKQDSTVKVSGSTDALPHNRFIRESRAKLLWIAAGVLIVLIYLAMELPVIFSRPKVAITFPSQSPYETSSSAVTITGTIRNADALYLSNDNASDTEEIPILSDGTWQKSVLLGARSNIFRITARKFLGGQTDILEEIFYEPSNPPGTVSSTASSTVSSTVSTSPPVHFYNSGEVPATGTFYQ